MHLAVTHACMTATAMSTSDLNSTNGTYVNGARVSAQQLLRPGDVVRIGDTELRFDNG